MNNQFDWNIKNYNITELEEIFELPTNFDIGTIESQAKKLQQKISNDLSLQSDVKQKTLKFIKEVKEALIKNFNKNNNIIESQNKQTSVSIENLFSQQNGIKQSEIVDAGGTYLIQQEGFKYVNALASPYNPGDLNPLKIRYIPQNLNIDTSFRDNYYGTQSSNFHIDLPMKLNGVVSLQLTALELPNTFYGISNIFGNNFFVIEINGYNPLMVTIPDGNYNYTSLQGYINNFFTNYAQAPYNKIQVLADENIQSGSTSGSGRMIFGSTDGLQPFSINFLTDINGNVDQQTPLPLKLGWLMGFREGFYENALTYVSEGIINLTGPSYMYLVVDDYNKSVNDGFYAAFNSSILNKNILARISLQGSVFNILSSTSLNTTPRTYFGPVSIQKLNIQLLDPYGRIMNLNNMDYSFCLTFNTIYNL